MDRTTSYRKRIESCSSNKDSRIILALDPTVGNDTFAFVKESIDLLQGEACAIKFNFHVILPLSYQEITNLNSKVHSYGLQSIADIKLNDISSTNLVVIDHLVNLGFDAVILNPIIGMDELKRVVGASHDRHLGVLALVYMSHSGAREGFGLSVIDDFSQPVRQLPLYQKMLEYAEASDTDGIIVGGTRLDIISSISRKKKLPIYSPGLGVQGGDPKNAAKAGTDFFIIGRSITQSLNPLKSASTLRKEINCFKND